MKIILNDPQTETTLDYLETLLDQIRREHRTLRRRHLDEKDGYRTRASGAAPTVGRTNETDDDGTPLPPRHDPTVMIVIARDDPTDTVGVTLATIVRKITQLSRIAESIVSDAAQVRPPITAHTDTIWCVNCQQHGIHEPREENRRLCRWCRAELAEHHQLPSRRLVLAHARDARITAKLRSEIAARDREERARTRTAHRTGTPSVWSRA